MGRRKNADKSTPWGYRRVYIEEQNRYVFVADKLVDRYQKNFLKKFGRLTYPTVAECIAEHKGNKYFYVCDIQDAFGNVQKKGITKILAQHRGRKKQITDKNKDKNFYVDIDLSRFTYTQIKKEEEVLIQELKDEVEAGLIQDDIYKAWGEYILKINKNKRLDWFSARYYFTKYADWRQNGKFILNLKENQKIFYKILKRNKIPNLSSIVFHLEASIDSENLSLEVGKKFSLDFLEYYFDIINFLSFEFHLRDELKFMDNRTMSKFFNSKEDHIFLEEVAHWTGDETLLKDNLRMLKHTNQYLDMPFYSAYFETLDSLVEKKANLVKDELFYYRLFENNPELDNKSWYYDQRKRRLVQNFECDQRISLFHNEKGLIQGSRCSPLIFEVLMIETVDQKLQELCQKYGLRYTRYRDDLIFSSSKKTIGNFLRKKIRKILVMHGFRTSSKKDKIVNLNKKDLIILGSKIDKNWNVNITPNQLGKKNKWSQDGNMKSSYEGMLAWERYLKKI